MTKLLRLQLSRAAGFNLQLLSLAENGRPAVNCSRSGRWGNPFVVGKPVDLRQAERWGWKVADPAYVAKDNAAAVRKFEFQLMSRPDSQAAVVEHLGGKNLACHCPPGAACHVDVLLEAANP